MSEPAVPTLAAAVARHAAAAPERIALTDGVRALTYAALDDVAGRLAAFFARQGIAAGDRIAVWMPNTLDWAAIEVAASRAGIAVIGINSRYKSDEVAYILSHSRAKALAIVSRHRDTDFIALTRGLLAEAAFPHLRGVLLCDDAAAAFEALPVWRLAESLAEPVPAAPPADPEQILNIIYTSGTTAAPKGVLLSERCLVPHAARLAEWTRIAAADRVLLLTPFCGIYGLDSLLMVLAAGATGIVVAEFDPEASLDLIVRERVSAVSGTVDATVKRWAEIQRRAPRDLSGIRGTVIPVGWMQGKPAAEMPAIEALLGVEFLHVYGLSESNALIVIGRPGDAPDARHPVSGYPLPGSIEARIADPEGVETLADDALGEIRLRGQALFSGYLDDPAATAAAFDAQGWFRTGDLGLRDAAGRIHYRGRIKDIIKVSGFTVSPAEVEAFLGRHDDLVSAHAVGYRQGGEERLGVVAVARPGARLSAEDLLAYCRGRIATFKIPSLILFLDRVPTKSGANSDKIDIPALRALLEGH